MSEAKTGFPKGRIGWIVGSVLLLVLGVIFGMIIENVWLGILIAAIVSLGWIIAYESWRGKDVGLNNPHDDGARV